MLGIIFVPEKSSLLITAKTIADTLWTLGIGVYYTLHLWKSLLTDINKVAAVFDFMHTLERWEKSDRDRNQDVKWNEASTVFEDIYVSQLWLQFFIHLFLTTINEVLMELIHIWTPHASSFCLCLQDKTRGFETIKRLFSASYLFHLPISTAQHTTWWLLCCFVCSWEQRALVVPLKSIQIKNPFNLII